MTVTDMQPLVKSKDTISKSVDAAMDKADGVTNGVSAGISVRNGPVEEMDVDSPVNGANGAVTGKRKSRASLTNGKSYKDASDSDDAPLVGRLLVFGGLR